MAPNKPVTPTRLAQGMTPIEAARRNADDLDIADKKLNSAKAVGITAQDVRIRDVSIASAFYQRVIIRQNEQILRQNDEIIELLTKIANGDE